MAKKDETIQLSKATIELMDMLRNKGVIVSGEPTMMSVYLEREDPMAIVKWSSTMWPVVKIEKEKLDIETLRRDGVQIQKTWNWRG